MRLGPNPYFDTFLSWTLHLVHFLGIFFGAKEKDLVLGPFSQRIPGTPKTIKIWFLETLEKILNSAPCLCKVKCRYIKNLNLSMVLKQNYNIQDKSNVSCCYIVTTQLWMYIFRILKGCSKRSIVACYCVNVNQDSILLSTLQHQNYFHNIDFTGGQKNRDSPSLCVICPQEIEDHIIALLVLFLNTEIQKCKYNIELSIPPGHILTITIVNQIHFLSSESDWSILPPYSTWILFQPTVRSRHLKLIQGGDLHILRTNSTKYILTILEYLGMFSIHRPVQF